MRGIPMLLTPSAEELREKYGELLSKRMIAEAAGLRMHAGNGIYILVRKRMEGRVPAAVQSNGRAWWTAEQVADALMDWAEAHREKPRKTSEPKPKQPKPKTARISKRCESCRFAWDTGTGDNGKLYACLYILATEERRPCPAEDCTVYRPRKEESECTEETF